MEEIEVTARYDENGRPVPSIFLWNSQSFLVDSLGRRWEDEAGQHLLVLVPGGQTFELLLASEDGHWYLKPVGNNHLWA